MFNQSILQLLPALLSMARFLIEHFQLHQIISIDLTQRLKVDQLLAQEQLQQLFVDWDVFQQLVLVEIVHQIDLFIIVR